VIGTGSFEGFELSQSEHMGAQTLSSSGLLGWGRRGTAGASIPKSLAFEGAQRIIEGRKVLHDVSFSVGAGEVVALVGPSGCGKSTLLRMAAGIEPLDGGRILLDGVEVARQGYALDPDKRGVGLLFQDYALFPHLTVEENVRFGLARYSREEARAAVERSLTRVGLTRYANTYPDALSGGEQQRVALARAIAPRPGVLLLDEPFSNLDRHLRAKVRDETLAVLRETRATSIMVTHDAEEALQVADRIVMMRAGQIVQVGRPEDVFLRPIGCARGGCSCLPDWPCIA
jgi:iron(III) transport system ATP-binding protein